MPDVTQLLNTVASGDRHAASELLPLVYDELRKLAAARMAQEKPGDTLQATALVHEAYLRLVGPADVSRWENRGHFFAAAAEAMRRILVDAARKKRREKYGGNLHRVELEVFTAEQSTPSDDIVALDEALTKLAVEDPEAARLVELRHFTGMTLPDAAQLIGISSRTADRIWAYAKAWLHRELTEYRINPDSGATLA